MNIMKCNVCSNGESEDERIVVCKNCKISVHLLCYGHDGHSDFVDSWECSPCALKIQKPTCALCIQENGALKKTTCGKWVHVICALFTPNVRFEDTTTMEPVDISNISQKLRNHTCIFCSTAVGFCVRCSKTNCNERLHVTCAQRDHCIKEVTNKKDDTIKFLAYCTNHKPKDTSRHLSSVGVQKRATKKTKKAGENAVKAMAAAQNSNYITVRVQKEKSVKANDDSKKEDTGNSPNEKPESVKANDDSKMEITGDSPSGPPKTVEENNESKIEGMGNVSNAKRETVEQNNEGTDDNSKAQGI